VRRKGGDRGKPRGGGFFGAGVLALVFLFSPFYAIQFAALFLLLVFFGSWAYSEYLIRNLRILRRDTELRVFRDEWVWVELVAENRGRLPAPAIAVTDSPGRLPVFRENRTLQELPPRSRRTIRWRVYCSSRGVFTLGPADFRGSDPLGLFPFRVSLPETVVLSVYPAAGMIALRPPGGLPLGTLLTGNPLYEDLTRCRSLRDYQAGDEPRRINWKASARNGGFMVNEYESTLSSPLVIFLNADPYAYPLHKRELQVERAVEAAAALCLMVSRERQELGALIYAPGTRAPLIQIEPAPFTLIPILERLAALERAGEEAPAPEGGGPPGLGGAASAMLDRGRSLPYGTRLVYAGPDLTEEEYRALDGLKRCRLSLEYLVIDERSLPALTPGNSRRYQMKEAGYEIL
jgi:uncharacterized protein (DUF58 family)